nr:MAG TPA: hypothetical protein [Caudoviricetes sp.]
MNYFFFIYILSSSFQYYSLLCFSHHFHAIFQRF